MARELSQASLDRLIGMAGNRFVRHAVPHQSVTRVNASGDQANDYIAVSYHAQQSPRLANNGEGAAVTAAHETRCAFDGIDGAHCLNVIGHYVGRTQIAESST
jgi:hypothetical protein